jgi:hypothetical protein
VNHNNITRRSEAKYIYDWTIKFEKTVGKLYTKSQFNSTDFGWFQVKKSRTLAVNHIKLCSHWTQKVETHREETIQRSLNVERHSAADGIMWHRKEYIYSPKIKLNVKVCASVANTGNQDFNIQTAYVKTDTQLINNN